MADKLLTPAKLREQVDGTADGGEHMLPSVGLADGPRADAALSFLARSERERGRSLDSSLLGRELVASLRSRRASRGLDLGADELLSYLVGMTDSELSADAVTVLSRMLDMIRNNDGPMQMVTGGLPETGKTNSSLLATRLWQVVYPDGVIVANMSTLLWADHYVTGADQLLDLLVEFDDDTRVLVILDEGSTWFDATSFRSEIRRQWCPLTKRFAKFAAGVDSIVVGHTLMDVHPELLRLATVVLWKEGKQVAQFFAGVDPEDRELTDPLFPDPLEPIEKIPDRVYDPDDMSPWSWDLSPERIENLGL